MTKQKINESRLISIATDAREVAAMELEERMDALDGLLSQLRVRGSSASFEEITRAMAMEVAGERHDSGEITAYIESRRDPMDLCWDSWDSEDAQVLAALYEALSATMRASLAPLDELLEELVEVYTDVFDAHRKVIARGRPA